MDYKEQLRQAREEIKRLSSLEDTTDEQDARLKDLLRTAVKLEAKVAAEDQNAKAEADAEIEREAETNRKIEEAVKRERSKFEIEQRRLPYGEAPYAAKHADEWKYDNLGPADLSVAIEVGKSLGVNFEGAAMKAMSRRLIDMISDEKAKGTEQARKTASYLESSFKLATKTGIEPTKESVEAAIKAATDPMYTGGSGIGSDWVGTAYSNAIWNVIRAENRVAGMVPSDVIPDGYSSKTWPLESTDMTWYKVAEATASDSTLKVPAATVTASQIATGSKNIPVAKIGARGIYTGELTEDSLIGFAGQLRAQLEISGAEIVESLFIDGDVETSANKNINNIDGTPTATDYFLSFDGFRKLALVTNTANSLSAGGGLTVEDFLNTMKLMGTAGLAGSDPTKCAFIIDGNVYYKMAQLSELKTRDTFNPATIENGFVTRIWNVPVMPSWQMHRASAKRMTNNAGKISGTDTNNTLGAAVSVRWDQWKQAYKRRMTIETTRIANADSYEIVALARLGLAYRDNEASAVLYNIGV